MAKGSDVVCRDRSDR